MYKKSLLASTVCGVSLLLAATAAYPGDDDSNSDRKKKHRPPASEFEFVTIIVERNDTDGDTEIVVEAKPDSDDGLRRFVVRSPSNKKVVDVNSARRVLGMREFAFESPEPAGDAILASYPEGSYTFHGVSTEGERFSGVGVLSHQLPAPIVVGSPMEDQELPHSVAHTLLWSQVSEDTSEIFLEFECETEDSAQVLTLNFAPDVMSFEIPASLLVPGAECQVGIAAIAETGNKIFTEVPFTTSE